MDRTGQGNDLSICQVVPDADIPEIVKLPLASFQGFFLTNLEPRFLTLMYRSIPQNPDEVHILPVDERIKGFVAGVVDQEQNLSFRLNPYLPPKRSVILRNRVTVNS